MQVRTKHVDKRTSEIAEVMLKQTKHTKLVDTLKSEIAKKQVQTTLLHTIKS